MYKRKYKEKFPVIAICYDFDYCEPHTCDFNHELGDDFHISLISCINVNIKKNFLLLPFVMTLIKPKLVILIMS